MSKLAEQLVRALTTPFASYAQGVQFKVRTPAEWQELDAHRASLREQRRLRRKARKA